MLPTVADQRSLTGVAATLSWQPLNGDGGTATPAGAVTVDIRRANGTQIVTAGVAAGTGPVTYQLAANLCAVTDVLSVVWKDAGTERARTTVELVGGYYASIADIRNSDPSLSSATYPDTAVIRARTEVEQAFSSLTQVDFTPHYHRERLDGSGSDTLVLGWGPLRSVRSVTVYATSATTTFTAPQLASIAANEGRLAVCGDATVFPCGRQNIVVEYESGYDTAPFDIRDQFFVEVRKQLNDNKSMTQIATQYDYDGGPVDDPTLNQQIRRLFSTLSRYSLKIPGVA